MVKSPVVLIAFYCQFHRLEVEDGIQRIPFQRSVYTLEHFEIGPGTSLGNMASPAPKPGAAIILSVAVGMTQAQKCRDLKEQSRKCQGQKDGQCRFQTEQ